ncbi:MAG TPA: hypothetical protein VND62_10055 [Acidimicrobiales bacterium]|nr:hypothetical protein [Acidimicrobiales bacterium]
MGDGSELDIGATVRCQDGTCGELARLLVDPRTETVTHLVVESTARNVGGRLVPIELVESATPELVSLGCTLARFDALDRAEQANVVPGFDQAETYTNLALFSRRGSVPMIGSVGLGLHGPIRIGPHSAMEDNVPDGEGEVSRGQHVHATDGPVGHVYGLVVDTGGVISHVLLGEGHLWGKKEVAVPVAAVKTVADDGIYLTLTKKEVGELPAVDLDRVG